MKPFAVSFAYWELKILASSFLKFKSKVCDSSPLTEGDQKAYIKFHFYHWNVSTLLNMLYLCKENELKWFQNLLRLKNQTAGRYIKKMISLDLKLDFFKHSLISLKPWGPQAYTYVLTAWKHNWFLWWLVTFFFLTSPLFSSHGDCHSSFKW